MLYHQSKVIIKMKTLDVLYLFIIFRNKDNLEILSLIT